LPIWVILLAPLGGGTLGIAYFFIVNTMGYANVFAMEQAIFGTAHRDTLYLASLAATIAKFGVVSTGLDGLVPVPYHFLAFALFGLLARWMDVAPIHAMFIGKQIVGIPLLFFGLSAATYWLWRPSRATYAAPLVVFVPLALLFAVEIWDWSSYLLSESYLLSLIFLLLSIPLFIELGERPVIRCSLARHLALAVVGVGTIFAKNSVGMIFAVGLVYVLMRTHRIFWANVVKFAVPVIVIAAVAIRATIQPVYTSVSPIAFLHFVKTYPDGAWDNIIAIVLLFAAMTIVAAIAERPAKLTLETLAILALTSLGAGLMIRAEAGSTYYFLNVGTWIAVVFGAGIVLIPRLDAIGRPALVVSLSVAAALIASLGLGQKRESFAKMLDLVRDVHAQAHRLAPGTTAYDPQRAPAGVTLFSSNKAYADIALAARESEGGRIRATLIQTGVPGSHDLLVYVPPSNETFWNLHKLCTAQPFFVGAVAAGTMIYGLPPSKESCPIGPEVGFGYALYGDESRLIQVSEQQVCRRTLSLGFKRVLVLDKDADGRLLNCI
jgi:hypothetical protein